ncbi:MAG: LacI family DNA-binding transcriptional regulator [Paracoccaceae bacterium]|nr:LacI family DNA-binding transcriptional regulator [Paracoccaceae bacterium]
MGKPTVHDIAKEAGVSLATVDRVLNRRPGVRTATVARVQAAVDKLGYVRDLYAANLARGRLYRLAFVLPEGKSQFLSALEEAVAEAATGLRLDRLDMHAVRVPADDPAAVRRAFERLLRQRVDGVAVMANETPMVRDMIARLKSEGIAVVALVTDQPETERDHFVGIDNVAAGRTAGVLMGRFLAGRGGAVMVMVNSTQARDMVERRLGFDEVLATRFPQLSALPSLEGHDDFEETHRLASRVLDQRDDVVGIYSTGAGLRGVTQAVADRGRDDIVVIGHELTAHSRDGLEAGLVDVIINQNVGHIIRSASRVLRAQCDGVDVIASQELIRIEIVLRENLPERGV